MKRVRRTGLRALFAGAIILATGGVMPICGALGADQIARAGEIWCCCGGCCGWSKDCSVVPGCTC